MPKINIVSVPVRQGCGYPPPFDAPCADRTRRRLGDAGGLRDYIDMKSANADGRFVHKDGTPYPGH